MKLFFDAQQRRAAAAGGRHGGSTWLLGEARTQATRNWASSSPSSSSSSAAAAAAEKKEDGQSGIFSSWISKLKGVFQSKAPSQHAFGEQSSAVDPSGELTQDYTLLVCADELRKVRNIEKVTSLLKLRVSEEKATEAMEKYESVLRALAKQDPTGKQLDAQQKAAAAKECRCSIVEINEALAKFEWMKETRSNVLQKVLQSKSRGEGLPKTMDEVKKLVKESNALKRSPPGGASLYPSDTNTIDVGRNSPCTCGSGKKYKRCCGRESR